MKSKLCLLATLLAVAVGAVSCVDENYDLSKLNTEITVGGDSLTVPVGETAKLTMKDLLGDNAVTFLKTAADGSYYISFSDQKDVSPSMPAINTSLNLGGTAPSVEIELLDLTAAAAAINALPDQTEYDLSSMVTIPPVAIDTNIQVTVSLDLPDAVKDLESVTFTNASKITVALSVEDCPLSDGELTPDIWVNISSVLSLVDSYYIELSDLKLNKANNYQASKQYAVDSLIIKPGDFNANLHKLSIDRKAYVGGTATVTGAKTTKALINASNKLKVKVAVTLSNLEINKVEAKIDYNLSQEKVKLDLGDLTGAFGDKLEVTMDLHNPSLKFDLTTNLGVPATVQATLVPWKDNAPNTQNQIQVSLDVNPAPSATQTSTMKYFLAAHNEGRPADYTYVAADIASLIKLMPDSVLVTLNAATVPTQTAVLEPAATYSFNMNYEVGIPIQVGPDFRLALRDTIEIGEVGKYLALAEEAVITGVVENSLPLNLKLVVGFTDADNNAIALAKAAEQSVAAGKLDGGATTTPLEVSVKFADKEAAKNVTKVVLSFEITSGGVARAVKETDYVMARVAAGLRGGITLDLKKLIEDVEDPENKE
ncbi:MAG: hypothetical protein IJK20_03595 [Bacteroidales bacterium]|nr:hypothetical protein [Bacteroidales bacterium]